jgi:hypothetical protein
VERGDENRRSRAAADHAFTARLGDFGLIAAGAATTIALRHRKHRCWPYSGPVDLDFGQQPIPERRDFRAVGIGFASTKAVGLNMLFGGREVNCGFTGKYIDGEAEVSRTALVGKTSILFEAVLNLKSPL